MPLGADNYDRPEDIARENARYPWDDSFRFRPLDESNPYTQIANVATNDREFFRLIEVAITDEQREQIRRAYQRLLQDRKYYRCG